MVETMLKSNQERRRYFRVTDLVGLRYQFLSQDEQALAIQAKPSSLKDLLKQIDYEVLANLAIIQSSQPEVYRLLDLLNQKINMALGSDKDQEAGLDTTNNVCSVNLSACGLAFPTDKPAALNQYISLELILYPNNVRLSLLSAAISCDRYEEESERNKYVIRADFVDISEVNQEVLVQHVIKRQAMQLKQQRGES
ncbi:MAG: c-di-GMP-binding flagellar brake protein YcgR [Oleiphilaceae bacterium]|jgi:c-di-GMP-binding flagellar brake protein YcgR